MRRAVTEWGLVVSLVLAAALGLVWLDTLYLGAFREPLALTSHLYVRADSGGLCIFSDLGPDWKPTETGGVDPKAMSWARSYINWFFPGIEYHCRYYVNGRIIWSIELAIIIPLCVLLMVMVVLWRVRRGGSLAPEPVPPSSGSIESKDAR